MLKFIKNNPIPCGLILFKALYDALALIFPLDFVILTIMFGGLIFLFRNKELLTKYCPKRTKITYVILIYELEIFIVLSYFNHFNLTGMVHSFWWMLVVFLFTSGIGFIEYGKSHSNKS